MRPALILLLLAACAGPREEPPMAAAGSRRMAARLAAIRQGQSPADNVFRNGERVARLLALPTPEGGNERLAHLAGLARELAWAGRTEEAIAVLEPLVAEVAQGGRPAAELELRRQLAVAYLRLGEQQNCVDHHSAASCLLPIRESGRHRRPEASRRAMEEYRRVLERAPDDLESRWLLNLAAMTVGAWPREIDAAQAIPPAVFDAAAPFPLFVDTAAERGLATFGLAGGVVVEDLDGDGRLDVMVSSWGLEDPLTVLLNDGRGFFADATASAGLEGLTGGLNLVPADFDNDGDVDVLVLRGGWLGSQGNYPHSLLANDGRARFEDVTEEAGVLGFEPGQTAAWGDYDDDGWLDLFVGTEATPADPRPCRLLHNDGDGSFTEVAQAEGAAVVGFVKGVVWGDYDNDGDLDLYVSRLDGPNTLLRNGGATASPRFADATAEAGVAEPWSSFPTWFFDYDNDGWLDLFVAGYAEDYVAASVAPVVADLLGEGAATSLPRLYRNRRDGTFEDVTARAGLARVLLAMGANFGDLDNDGWLDFYLGTGAPSLQSVMPNRMFRGVAGESFEEVTFSGGFGHLQKGHGVSFADVDGDGDQDVLEVIGGAFSGDGYANALFENPGNDNAWLTVRLIGRSANRMGVGARLRLLVRSADGVRELHRVVGTGGSFGANSLQAEIGLGPATRVERLEILWPGDRTPQHFDDLAVRQVLEIEQGALAVRVVDPAVAAR